MQNEITTAPMPSPINIGNNTIPKINGSKKRTFFRTFFKKFPSASNVSRYKPKMIKSTLPLNPGDTPPIPTMIPFKKFFISLPHYQHLLRQDFGI